MHVELNDVNGGSFQVYVRNDEAVRGRASGGVSVSVEEMRATEAALRLHEPGPYVEFARRIEALKERTVSFVRSETAAGKGFYVYGASTKGNTLLQYYGLDATLITAAAERNPDKWGKMTVGTHIPIVSEEEEARAANPDYFLVVPRHFMWEFVERERPYLERGGRVVAPLPEFRIVGAEDQW